MKVKKRRRVLTVAALIAILAVSVLIQQRVVYEAGTQSFIFGQKSGYSQNQAMPLGGLLFSVQKVGSVAYTPYVLTNCSAIQENYSLTRRCLHTNDLKRAHNESYNDTAQYQIAVSVKNVQNHATNLASYRFSFDSSVAEVLSENIDTTNIIPGASKTLSINIRVPQTAQNLKLLIQSGTIAKYFNLRLRGV